MRDAEAMVANWVTDAEVTRFWGWQPHENIEETKRLLADWIAAYASQDHYHWVIEHKETAQAIGYIYLNEFEDDANRAAVHYLLSRKFWNKGLMTEACTKVLAFAFERIGLDCVVSRHHEKNPASGRVLQKCGLRLVDTQARVFEDGAQLNGEYHFYGLLKSEWTLHKF